MWQTNGKTSWFIALLYSTAICVATPPGNGIIKNRMICIVFLKQLGFLKLKLIPFKLNVINLKISGVPKDNF